MTALRDDMTLAEAQAEAERRWPGAVMEREIDEAEHYWLLLPPPLGAQLDPVPPPQYVATAPVGCLDQAIAAEARRKR